MDQAGHSIIDVTGHCLHVQSLTLGNHNSLVFPSSPSVPSLDLPSLLVAELGLLPGQNLTGRCLTLDAGSKDTLPISVAGVLDMAAMAADITGATALVVECAVECTSKSESFLVDLFKSIFGSEDDEECSGSGSSMLQAWPGVLAAGAVLLSL